MSQYTIGMRKVEGNLPFWKIWIPCAVEDKFQQQTFALLLTSCIVPAKGRELA